MSRQSIPGNCMGLDLTEVQVFRTAFKNLKICVLNVGETGAATIFNFPRPETKSDLNA